MVFDYSYPLPNHKPKVDNVGIGHSVPTRSLGLFWFWRGCPLPLSIRAVEKRVYPANRFGNFLLSTSRWTVTRPMIEDNRYMPLPFGVRLLGVDANNALLQRLKKRYSVRRRRILVTRLKAVGTSRLALDRSWSTGYGRTSIAGFQTRVGGSSSRPQRLLPTPKSSLHLQKEVSMQ